jgi:hypothetical protein
MGANQFNLVELYEKAFNIAGVRYCLNGKVTQGD